MTWDTSKNSWCHLVKKWAPEVLFMWLDFISRIEERNSHEIVSL